MSQTNLRLSETEQPSLPDMALFQMVTLATSHHLGPASGQELSEEIGHHYGQEINHGRLYPNLNALARAGLLHKERHKPNERTNTYRITEDGLFMLREHAQWLVGMVDGQQGEGA